MSEVPKIKPAIGRKATINSTGQQGLIFWIHPNRSENNIGVRFSDEKTEYHYWADVMWVSERQLTVNED